MTRRDRERSENQRRDEYQRDDQDSDRTPARARVDSHKHAPNLPQIMFRSRSTVQREQQLGADWQRGCAIPSRGIISADAEDSSGHRYARSARAARVPPRGADDAERRPRDAERIGNARDDAARRRLPGGRERARSSRASANSRDLLRVPGEACDACDRSGLSRLARSSDRTPAATAAPLLALCDPTLITGRPGLLGFAWQTGDFDP